MHFRNTCDHSVTSLLSVHPFICLYQSHCCPHLLSIILQCPVLGDPSWPSLSSVLTACPGLDDRVLSLCRLHFPWDDTQLQHPRGRKGSVLVVVILVSVWCYRLSLRYAQGSPDQCTLKATLIYIIKISVILQGVTANKYPKNLIGFQKFAKTFANFQSVSFHVRSLQIFKLAITTVGNEPGIHACPGKWHDKWIKVIFIHLSVLQDSCFC